MFAEVPVTLVLDLDDTLYPERDYVRSGMLAVAATVRDLTGEDVEGKLLGAVDDGEKDPLGLVLNWIGRPQWRDQLLWIYRLHRPTIALADEVRAMIVDAAGRGWALAILTDGRSTSQRRKLDSLGLSDIPAYVSDEWDGPKPAPGRFEAIMRVFPAERHVYVGDNPLKDFITPHRLGWRSVWYRGNAAPVHSQYIGDLAPQCRPDLELFHWSQWPAIADRLLEG